MQVERPIVEILQKLSQQTESAFYAPGHKKGQGIASSLVELLGNKVFTADLPELPELDNLFAPTGVIKEAEELASKTFGAEKTWFLVNGSTCGVIASILATCSPGSEIILPRNTHQSAIAGLILSGAIPIFINPEYDPHWDLCYSISPNALKIALNAHPQAKAVFITYPTYQGVTGHLEQMVQITKAQGIPLIVDEAHGAHFTFHPDLPPSALSLGADLVIQSTHKVLGSLTQSSMLHLKGEKVAPERVSRALELVQSTSPSYILLASLDAARAQMELNGEQLLTRTLNLAQTAKKSLKEMAGLSILEKPQNINREGFADLDLTRLTVKVSEMGLTGFWVDRWLREVAQVTAELPNLQHLTFMITIGNTLEDIQNLLQAFLRLVNESQNVLPVQLPLMPFFDSTQITISPREAFFCATKTVKRASSVGYISAELICPYPPGIPLIMPGEYITQSHLDYVEAVFEQQGTITGCSDPSLNTLKVID